MPSQISVKNTISITTAKCKECGKVFQPVRKGHVYCTKNCRNKKTRNNARTFRRITGYRYFYGIDGELGLDDNGNEVYQLLGCGNDDTYNYVYEKNGLHWEQVLEFLWSCYEQDHREATVYAGFFLRFDFSQWFKTFPEFHARLLFTASGKRARLAKSLARQRRSGGPIGRPMPVSVWIQGPSGTTWLINGIGERLIRIKKKGSSLNYMAINDAGPFFQTSLVNAIHPKGWIEPICTDEEFDEICRGKANRSNVGDSLQEIPYNKLENALLCRMLTKYNDGLFRMGIQLGIHQWFGPGQAAQEWFKNIGIPRKDETLKALGPYWDLCIQSYYGGWFEIFCHGMIIGTTYEYDINSAYPSIMAELPCILHGTWTEGIGTPERDERSYVLVDARVSGSDPYIGSMLHRVSTGAHISRPRNTSGIYWDHELAVAKKAGLIDHVFYRKWYKFTPNCSCPFPLAEIADLYSERQRIGKNTAEGKAFKLIYNSAYGKLAQSVGGSHFANPFYASLITAGCRIKILEAIASHPLKTRGVAMVATDAVFFLTPHPDLPISEKLGEWGAEEKTNLFIFKPGHYWDRKTKDKIAAGEAAPYKARGVNARDFSAVIGSVEKQMASLQMYVCLNDAALKKGYINELPKMPNMWPKATYNSSFSVVTIGQALSWNDWKRCGEILHGVEIGPIQSNPRNKRDDEHPYLDNSKRFGFSVVRSKPYDYVRGPKGIEKKSTPYDKKFGEEREDQWANNDVVTPDGDYNTLILDALGQGK